MTELEGTWYFSDKAGFEFDPSKTLESQLTKEVNVPFYPENGERDLIFAKKLDFSDWETTQHLKPALTIRHNGEATAIAVFDATGAKTWSTPEALDDPRLSEKPSYEDHFVELLGQPPFRIVVRISSQFHGQPGWWWPPEIGTIEAIERAEKRSLGWSFLTIGLLFIIGIYHGILFIQRRRERGALYFAIFCLNFSLREFLVQKHLLLFAEGISPFIYQLHLRIEYATMPVAAISEILMVQSLLDQSQHLRRIKRVIFGFLGIVTLGCLLPTEIFTSSTGLRLHHLGIIAALVVSMSDILTALQRKHPEAKLITVGFIVLIVGVVNDLVVGSALLEGDSAIYIGSYTFILFILIKASIISRKFAQAYEDRDENQRKLLQAYQELDEELLNRENLVEANQSLEAEIKLAGEQLIQADKLATLGTVVAGVAHDIASPSNLIIYANEVLEENRKGTATLLTQLFEEDDSPEAQEVLSFFKEKLGKMEKAETDIQLGISRINAIQSAIRNQSRNDQDKISFSLRELVDECLVILNTKLKSVEVQNKIPAEMLLTGRRSQIGQVYTKLISNSADAVLEKREADRSFEPIILLTTHVTADGQVHLYVDDNGDGVPKELREKIQEAFFTTKGVGKGTGLGMSIILKILGEHGYSLSIGESPDLGGARMDIQANAKRPS